MTTVLKWVVPFFIVIGFVLFIASSSSQQNTATRTTAELETLADTVASGVIRSELDEKGQANRDIDYIEVKEVIANLTANLMAVQKRNPHDIQLDYVLLDQDGKVTTDEQKVRSVQFRVQHIDEKGTVKGNAERRLSLNQLN